MKKIIFIILIFSSINSIYAKETLSSFPLLTLIGNSRAEALAGAYTAVADSSSGVYYNPAALNRIENIDASLGDIEWIADVRINTIGYAQKFNFGTIGINLGFLTTAEFKEIDTIGNLINNSLSMNEFLISCSYARIIPGLLKQSIYIGTTLKFFNSKLIDKTSTVLGMDIGIQTPDLDFMDMGKEFSAGLIIKNIGLNLKPYEKEKDSLPFSINAGIKYLVYKEDVHSVKIVCDTAGYIIDKYFNLMIGSEYIFDQLISLRAGYKIGSDIEYITAGLGIKYTVSGIDLSLNYTLKPIKDFGPSESVHLITLEASWRKTGKGEIIKEAIKEFEKEEIEKPKKEEKGTKKVEEEEENEVDDF